MKEQDFINWLKGFSDALGSRVPNLEEWDKIRHETALVFNKITPYRPSDNPLESLVNVERSC